MIYGVKNGAGARRMIDTARFAHAKGPEHVHELVKRIAEQFERPEIQEAYQMFAPFERRS